MPTLESKNRRGQIANSRRTACSGTPDNASIELVRRLTRRNAFFDRRGRSTSCFTPWRLLIWLWLSIDLISMERIIVELIISSPQRREALQPPTSPPVSSATVSKRYCARRDLNSSTVAWSARRMKTARMASPLTANPTSSNLATGRLLRVAPLKETPHDDSNRYRP